MTKEEKEAFEAEEKEKAEELEAERKKLEEEKKKLEAEIDPDTLKKLDELAERKAEEKLKGIKSKLDSAFEARDKALKKAAELDAQIKEKELKQLKEEGKHQEAFELELQELKAKNEALAERNVKLTRDIDVRSALNSYDFRNERAIEMATKEIVANLIQDEKGVWVHTSGISIKEYVASFAKNEDNQFLFKVKGSKGGGTKGVKGNATETKSLFEMTQAEAIEYVRKQKLKD